MNLLVTNIKSLFQVRDSTPSFLAGDAMAILPAIDNAYLATDGDKISAFGEMSDMPSTSGYEVIDAKGGFLFPSFVDSHTHLVFAAYREEEFVLKIKGATYEQIAASGGGILNSAKKLQGISEDELLERSLPRAWEIIRTGTGAVEIKSGYGLTVKDEIKMLRVAKRIGKETPLLVKTTFLGAHAVPREMKKEDYINLILEEMIPAVAEERLADYIDAFCEEGFFTQSETERIMERGKQFGMTPRIHANQLHRSGGVQAGVNTGAISVDHLENIGDEEIELLKGTKTMPTALPGAAFFINLPMPPARRMLLAGLPLAIASDYNPGSAPSGNMLHMISLACIRMKVTPEEAVNACTINTAYTLGLLKSHGSITKGKTANFFLTKPMPSLAYMPYRFGERHIERIVLGGSMVD